MERHVRSCLPRRLYLLHVLHVCAWSEPTDISFEVGSATATGAPAASVQKLDIYQPEGDTEPRRPVIVWLHGGGFKPGTADFLYRELRTVR